MKKLIVFSVIFALVAGSVFAVDVTGTVFGHVNVIEGSTMKDSTKGASGGMDRVRLDGAGQNDEGTFGGYVRIQFGNKGFLKADDYGDYADANGEHFGKDAADFVLMDSAYAWWAPIDQVKLIIGGFSDGIWGKEGVTGWGFNQMPNDSGIAINPGIYFGGYWQSGFYAGGAYMHSRYTFFEGFNEFGAAVEIKPLDILSINVAVPFISQASAIAGDVYKKAIIQADLNIENIGNIAVTYDGGGRAARLTNGGGDGVAQADGAIFIYYGNTFGELGVDVGFSYHLTDTEKGSAEVKQPIGLGLGLKYKFSDAVGIKFKATAALSGDDKNTYINASILPYFTINDSLTAFVNAGLGYTKYDQIDDVTGWFFNPYLRVGAEWGPTFYAGIQVASDGTKNAAGDKTIGWAVPIAIMISF